MKNSLEHITFRPAWTITERTANLLGQCYAYIRAITNTPIRPDYRKRLLEVSLRRGALATTAIEGNTLSEKELDQIEAGKNLPPSRQYQQREVQNVIQSLNLLCKELVEEKKPEVISVTLIRRFHKLVSRGLGDGYGNPGHFRRKNVTTGAYRPPSFEQVEGLVKKFCDWSSREFHYTGGSQHIDQALLQAIVSHVYIAWIHPFLDGNGRTARLLEFYLLLRSGVPDIASHLLSNHYNNTRDAYYRQLQNAVEKGDLTDFIYYALEGLRDGLEHDVLKLIHDDQIDMTWKNYVHDITEELQKTEGKNRKVIQRIRQLAYYLPSDRLLAMSQIKTADIHITQAYEGLTRPTIKSDLDLLVRHDLLIDEDGKYRSAKETLRVFMPGTSSGITKHF
jgi:Fic family protein